MSRFDFVVFGATGYTGKWTVRHLATNENFQGLTWAIAGRNEAKLREVLKDVGKLTEKNLDDVQIILADINDDASLTELAKQAKVIVNTAGPYELYGEPVVRAAVENGASHVDISGEDFYINRVALKYGETAKKNGVFIVSACGWGGIPVDVGIAHLKQNFDGDLSHVDMFNAVNFGPQGYSLNTGTYDSALGAIENLVSGRGRELLKQLLPEELPEDKYAPRKGFPLRSIKDDGISGYALASAAGFEESIVKRTQYFDYFNNKKRPVSLRTYWKTESLLWTILFFIWQTFFFIGALIPPVRRLLKKYPTEASFGLFKPNGPTEEQVQAASFTNWLVGYGWDETLPAAIEHDTPPNKKVVLRIDGPDPIYNATAAFLLSSALAIAKEKNLPEGGALTAAVAFGKTDLLKYLEDFGITFKITHTSRI